MAMKLCAGATSAAPAECFKASQKLRLPVQARDRITVCRGASIHSPEAPPRCLADSLSRGLALEHAISICGAVTSLASSECAARAPHYLPQAFRAKLCHVDDETGANPTVAAARCASKMPTRFNNWPDLVVQICAKAVSTMPARCAAAVPMYVGVEDTAALCTRASSLGPAHCMWTAKTTAEASDPRFIRKVRWDRVE